MNLNLLKKSSTIIILAPFLFLLVCTKILNNYYYHDTLVSFELFKYFYDFLITFNDIPVWNDSVDGGVRISYSILSEK